MKVAHSLCISTSMDAVGELLWVVGGAQLRLQLAVRAPPLVGLRRCLRLDDTRAAQGKGDEAPRASTGHSHRAYLECDDPTHEVEKSLSVTRGGGGGDARREE
jgi:hypothetical protein